jgi:hypothetical protein
MYCTYLHYVCFVVDCGLPLLSHELTYVGVYNIYGCVCGWVFMRMRVVVLHVTLHATACVYTPRLPYTHISHVHISQQSRDVSWYGCDSSADVVLVTPLLMTCYVLFDFPIFNSINVFRFVEFIVITVSH